MIHIVTEAGDAVAELHQRGGSRVGGEHDRSAVVGDGHAATHLGGEEREVVVFRLVAGVLRREVAHDIVLGADRGEKRNAGSAAARRGCCSKNCRYRPPKTGRKPVSGTTARSQPVALRNGATMPAACASSRSFCICSRPPVAGWVFVFKLHADDRSAVLPVESVQLAADFAEVALHAVKVGRAIGACRPEREQPVGKTAVAYFAVAPRADAHPDQETVLGTQLDEPPQVAPAGPVELALGLLMVNPEYIRRHNSDTAGLHLEELRFPFLRG